MLVLLTGCAVPEQQPPPPSYPPANLVNPPPKPINVPPDPLTTLPMEVRNAIVSADPKPLHEGMTTLFPYSPHTQPVISCQPLRVTEIVLNKDEKVTSNGVAAGDAVRWNIAPLDDRVLVKPTEAGISTDLIIETNRRSYHFTLRTRAPYMAQIAFYYPDDILAQQAARAEALHRAAQQVADPIASKPLNFAYRIEGPNYSWRPLQVFSDESHAYVQFPDNVLGADLPVLYIQNGKEQELVNYTVNGSYFVTDRLFKQAALTSGNGANREMVRIEAE
jgi:type IV secretion system protein VirB9